MRNVVVSRRSGSQSELDRIHDVWRGLVMFESECFLQTRSQRRDVATDAGKKGCVALAGGRYKILKEVAGGACGVQEFPQTGGRPDIRKAVRTCSLQWSIVVKVNRAGRRSGLQQVRVHSPLPVWSGSLGKREG